MTESTRAANLGRFHVRKWFLQIDEALANESGRLADGEPLRRIVVAAAGMRIESYGKACLVGAAGEYEHGNMLLSTTFADPVRMAVGDAKAWIPSSGKRSAPGVAIDIPLAHKDALYVRSHYDTVAASFSDAPASDEVLIAFAVASRGRLHARLGGIKASEIRGVDGLR